MGEESVRIGIDFGYRWTGLAILNTAGEVLAYRVLEFRSGKTALTDTLAARRINRSQRRRSESRRKRLRDFKALLKGLGIPPHENPRNATERAFVGNKLYALAHYRGWDYSDLTELLVEERDGVLKRTALVGELDRLLIDDYAAEKGEPRFDKKNNKYWPRIKESCLDLPALANVRGNGSEEAEAAALETLLQTLRDAAGDKKKLAAFIHERLIACGVPENSRAEAGARILVELGVQDGRELFDKGLIYTPHRNRHRSEVLMELGELLLKAMAQPTCRVHIESLARNQGITEDDAKARITKNANGILNHAYREKRFLNRSMGKCPVNLHVDQAGGEQRCNRNLPKRSRPDIRKLQFEIEARQMNVKRKSEEQRKITTEELSRLLACVESFGTGGEHGQTTRPGRISEPAWAEFFTQLPTPRVKDDARGKKEIFRDLILGEQAGRHSLCKRHLEEKLALLKVEGGTESRAWAAMHSERVLTPDDAPPSIRQKLEVTARELNRLLDDAAAKLGVAREALNIIHIGLETGRFDIRALASNEGRKLKRPRAYQERGDANALDDLRVEQNGRCFYCGLQLGGDATVDHVHARALGGANTAENRVAAHRICNIEKNRGQIQPHPDVLSLLPERKRRVLERILVEGRLPYDPTVAAQHTQFGAKLLKGTLVRSLGLQSLKTAALASVFKHIPARETDYLRSQWFTHWHHQKRALRAKEKDKTVLSLLPGEEKSLELNHTAGLAGHVLKWGQRPAPEWITVRDRHLHIQPPTLCKPGVAPPEGIYNIWVEAVDEATGEMKQEAKPLRFVVLPAEDDPIRQFHHALDAIILAADVDWARFIRLGSGVRVGHPDYLKTVSKAVKTIAPHLPGLAHNQPPPHPITFVKRDSPDSNHMRSAKTDTQPLRVQGGKIYQRKPLDQVSREDVDKLPDSHPLKMALQAAFDHAQSAAAESRKVWLVKTPGSQKLLLQKAYFLRLPKTHALHPHNARGIRLEVAGTGVDQMFYVRDRNNGARHAFKRLVSWNEVKLFKRGNKLIKERFKHPFYVNKVEGNQQSEVPQGSIDTGQRIRRGDVVRAPKHPGLWRVSKLGESATLVPKDLEAMNSLPKGKKEKEITAAYSTLTPE